MQHYGTALYNLNEGKTIIRLCSSCITTPYKRSIGTALGAAVCTTNQYITLFSTKVGLYIIYYIIKHSRKYSEFCSIYGKIVLQLYIFCVVNMKKQVYRLKFSYIAVGNLGVINLFHLDIFNLEPA